MANDIGICVWVQEADSMRPDCGIADNLRVRMKPWTQNAYYNFSFCPFCGREIVIQFPVEQQEAQK